ncbi:MAG: S41 family peptidase [Alphaproteobacteria bacterium]
MTKPSWRILLGAIASLAVAACGGGGGGGGSTGGAGSGAGAPTGPTWTQGVFQSASTFINKCATVRTGRDSEGQTFPDQAGSLAQELFWLRSWTHETYLWNTEVTDQNPAAFSDRVNYFNVLKTNAVTASGKLKDQFHFVMTTADYLAQSNSAPEASYGAEIRVFAGSPPRDVRVVYTTAGTPATDLLTGTPKLTRGTKILTVDGVDVVNGGTTQAQIDILNNGTFPLNAGESHTFTVQYPDNSQRSITLVSAALVESPVNRTAVLHTSSGDVGYILFNTFSPFSSEKALVDAIALMKTNGVNDVVIDLRYNGGGLLAVASELSYMIAGSSRTAGHNFESLQFNAAAGSTDPVTGGANTPTPFYNTALGFSGPAAGTALQSLNLPRVYVLSTSNTCSASESVINGLRGANVDVSLIGSGTCGKPYGFYPADNCGETYFSIQFKGINDVGFGDYADGFIPQNSLATYGVRIPGCAVADDYTHELGDANEAMLSAALGYRANGSCPTPPPSSLGMASVSRSGPSIKTTGRSEAEQILRNMRDLRMPNRGGAVR